MDFLGKVLDLHSEPLPYQNAAERFEIVNIPFKYAQRNGS